MGVYYKVVNLEKKERIEPERLGEGGIKEAALVLGQAARVLAFAMADGLCAGWQIVDDSGGEDVYYGSENRDSPHYCADMTEFYVTRFNSRYPQHAIDLDKRS